MERNKWKFEIYGDIKTKEGMQHRVRLIYEWKTHHSDVPIGADHIVSEIATFDLLVGPFLKERLEGKAPSKNALRQAAINRAKVMMSYTHLV